MPAGERKADELIARSAAAVSLDGLVSATSAAIRAAVRSLDSRWRSVEAELACRRVRSAGGAA